MAMPVSTEMGVTALTVTAQMAVPKIGTFVPPFTAGVPVSTSVPTSPNPRARIRFDDRVINMQNFSRAIYRDYLGFSCSETISLIF